MKSRTPTLAAAISLTSAAIVCNVLVLGAAVTALNIGLVAALFAWLISDAVNRAHHRLVGPVFLAMIAVQTLHFLEEYTGRLYETAPPLFGLAPLSPHTFVVFNLVWIAVFLVAAVGVFKGLRLPLIAVWFMALVGGIGNALFHSWLSIRDGSRVPGVVTSMINLPLGIVLVVLLTRSAGGHSLETRNRDRVHD